MRGRRTWARRSWWALFLALRLMSGWNDARAAAPGPCPAGQRPVAAQALPSSVVLTLLRPEVVPSTVCRAADTGAFTWAHDGSRYRYVAGRAPPGGNARGPSWDLRIGAAPAAAARALRRERYPFLACAAFSASRYCGWHLAVARDGGALTLQADDIHPPCAGPAAWPEVLDALTRGFTRCGAQPRD
ncbi:MAG: hypothetical protein U1F43_20560 [Myxococcota bacterium]